jgi:hypothetical protein
MASVTQIRIDGPSAGKAPRLHTGDHAKQSQFAEGQTDANYRE